MSGTRLFALKLCDFCCFLLYYTSGSTTGSSQVSAVAHSTLQVAVVLLHLLQLVQCYAAHVIQ